MSRIETGRGPTGQKQPKPDKKPPQGLKAKTPIARSKKRIPPRSKKRAAYMASPQRKDAEKHMEKVSQCGCFVCGSRIGVEVHHLHGHEWPRTDWHVVPLCRPHHRREFGEGSFHYSPSAFIEKHGTFEQILAKVDLMIEENSEW